MVLHHASGKMNESNMSNDAYTPAYVPHSEFLSGLSAGRFRVIVNPDRAKKYVKHRLFIIGICTPMIGIGVVLSLWGYLWVGLPLLIAGVALHRLVTAHAPKILLHLATQDPSVYDDAIEYEIMEVRIAGGASSTGGASNP
jgi:hypothetical protein